MQDENRIIHRTTDEARGGETSNVMRWVLGFSLLAAIIAMSAIWITGAVRQDQEPASVSSQDGASKSD